MLLEVILYRNVAYLLSYKQLKFMNLDQVRVNRVNISERTF